MRNTFLFLSLFSFIFSSCSLSSSATATATQPAPTLPPPTFTPAPTATFTPTPPPAPERAFYTLNVLMDYDAHRVTVDETIIYPNHTGNQLNALTLAAVPNLWSGFAIQSVRVDDEPLSAYWLDGQRLDVALTSFIQPEAVVTVQIQYTLDLPFAEQEDPNIARPRIYGYTSRQLNLVNWYPFVVPYVNGEWVLHEPWYYGEHLVYESADYEVNLRFADPANAPTIAASGIPEVAPDSTRYTIAAARAFAIAASREFQTASTQVGDVTVSSYYFPAYKWGGQEALKAASEALLLFNQKYAPYPHKTLSIVMGDFNDGMEYSAFFYLSRDFYNLYNGTPDSYLTFVSVHETSHQWWFEQVGNDQAEQPWLDESLAAYSEILYYEHYYPKLVNWWWSYRVDYYNPQGFVDIPIYEGGGFRSYTNSTYFQGAHFLHLLRERMGNEAFFAFLQDYAAQGKNKIFTAHNFFSILSQHTQSDYADLVRQYFRSLY